MNIETQCCGLAILFFVLFFYVRQRKLGLKNEKTYLILLFIIIASVVFDILSVVLIYNKDNLPILLVNIVAKAYLISLILLGVNSLFYIIGDLRVTLDDFYKTMCLYLIWTGVFIFAVAILPIDYIVDKNKNIVFCAGPSLVATYLCVASYLIQALHINFKAKNYVNQERRKSIYYWMGMWIASAIFQILSERFLIVGFACSMGLLFIYIKFENPDLNMDKITGLFNQRAFITYVNQMIQTKQEYYVVAIAFDFRNDSTVEQSVFDSAIMEAVNYINAKKDITVFINGQDEVLVVYKNLKLLREYGLELEERFEKGWGTNNAIILSPYIICIKETRLLKTPEDILTCIRYLRVNNIDKTDSHFVYADENMIYEMYEQHRKVKLIVDSMDNDRIEVFYQPIFSTYEQFFISAEALVRIRDEKGKIVPPSEFVEIAEKNGLIIQLGEIVFRKVCQFLKNHSPSELGIKYIEVNLSMIQCEYVKLADDYIAIMQQYDIDPKWINLEITESASTVSKTNMLKNIDRLRAYGVHFSLDDFGTGHSNLNYIVDMPVNIVKFDKEMINSYFENGKAKYVMEAAMHMIQGMNLKIVSEGIEDETQYNKMYELGINYIQGYYFSKPLPQDEFIKYLKNVNAKGV